MQLRYNLFDLMTSPRSDTAPWRHKSARAGERLAFVGALTAALASFLPWAQSGQSHRNSYELVAVAHRLEVLPAGVAGARVLWYVVPALVAAMFLAWVLERRALASTLAALVGLLSAVAAVLTARSPVSVEGGAVLAGGAGAVAVAGAALRLVGKEADARRDV